MADARIVRRPEGEVNERLWRFKHGSLTGRRFDFMTGKIEYCAGPPLHVHRKQDETLFVLDGVLAVQVRDEVFDLGPGHFATVPPGVPHTFGNIRPDQPAVQLCNLMTLGGIDRQFRDLALMGTNAADPEKVARLREERGITMVGPALAAELGLA